MRQRTSPQFSTSPYDTERENLQPCRASRCVSYSQRRCHLLVIRLTNVSYTFTHTYRVGIGGKPVAQMRAGERNPNSISGRPGIAVTDQNFRIRQSHSPFAHTVAIAG